MELIQDLKEFIRLLEEHDVRYLLVGGVAVNALGFVRMTEDVDFWLERSEANADRALAMLREFGFGEFAREELLDQDAVLMLGRPPNRIDLLTGISARDFADCYERRVYGTIGGVRVPIISLDDLLINKRACGRPKDLADIDEFERRHRRGNEDAAN
ncbi:MAG TPA: nucleotidyltransferase [Rhodanobacteraceae bacterium]|nr:nucleotidyltransferase [Rhodanobacteraceae bacterium]